MSPSLVQLLIVLVVALLLFGGRGRISSIMGDMAKGIKSFRHGLSDEEAKEKEEADKTPEQRRLEADAMVNVTPEKEKTKTSS